MWQIAMLDNDFESNTYLYLVVSFSIRKVPLFTEVELSLRMQLQSWLEISSGMMSFDLNGIRCLLTLKYLKSALILVE